MRSRKGGSMLREKLHDQNIKALVPIPPPSQYLRELPITGRMAARVISSRQQIRRVLTGEDNRMLVIVGPCSIHDERAGLEYAHLLAQASHELQDHLLLVMRVYFEKPRTTIGWKGLINEPNLDGVLDVAGGLRRARAFLLEVARLGIPAATEWVDPITPQYLADLVSWGAIGARTTESQPHRQLASGLSMPIGFKNGTGGTRHSIQIAVNGMVAARTEHAFLSTDRSGRVIVAYTKGNPDVHLILRGGEQGPNYGQESVVAACAMLAKAGFPHRLLVDCSHDNSGKDHARQPLVFQDVLRQRMEGNPCVAGVMLESHLHEGKQSLNGNATTLKYGVSITDGCIGWDQTVELLREAHRALSGDVLATAKK
jgi:3-deoxy-7-phosphoheptulonate synthase